MGLKSRIVTLCRFGHGANDMYWFILPAVLPTMLVEYGFTYTAAGGFLTTFLFSVAVFSFVGGKLADRIKRSTLIAGGFYLASAALVAAGLAPGFLPFLLLLLVAGAGIGSFHPVAYAVIDSLPGAAKGRMYSRYEIAGAIGVLLLLLVNGLIGHSVGWKNMVVIATLPGFAMGTAFLLARNDAALSARAAPASPPSEAARSEGTTTSRAAAWVLPAFFASIVLRTLSTASVINFMPVFLRQAVGLSGTLGSFTAGIIFLGAIAANLIAGPLVDRHGPVVVLTASSATLGLLLLLTPLFSQSWLLIPVLFVLGGAASASIPGQNIILSSASDPLKRGAAFGSLMGIMTVANSSGPLVLGVIADRVGLAGALSAASAPVLLSIALVLLIARRMPSTAAHAAR